MSGPFIEGIVLGAIGGIIVTVLAFVFGLIEVQS